MFGCYVVFCVVWFCYGVVYWDYWVGWLVDCFGVCCCFVVCYYLVDYVW